MAEETGRKNVYNVYTVTLVEGSQTRLLTSDTSDKAIRKGALPPRYDKQSEDQAFHVAWKQVGQTKPQNPSKPKPKLTEDSLKLRKCG